MVRIDKSTVAVPLILSTGGKGETAIQDLFRLYEDGLREFKTTHFFSEIYGDRTVKSLLLEIQHGKCCFCEQKRPHGREGDVEHFRPKTGFQIDKAGRLIKPGYYWLAYDFSNLFYACKVCNQEYKKNFFPLADENKRAKSHHDNWQLEDCLLIHPEFDNPEDHIEFVAEIAKPKNGSLKGKTTIEVVGLNDLKLVEQRFEYLRILKKLAPLARKGDEESKEVFKEVAKKDHQFSYMVRCNFPDLV